MKRTTGVILSVVALFLFFIGSDLNPTSSHSRTPGPLGDPASSALLLSVGGQQYSREITQSALAQIQALEAEKDSRTSAQQKIDSQLLYAIKLRRGQSIAAGVQTLAVDVGADDAGLVTVEITATVDNQLLNDLAGIGTEVLSAFPQYHSLRAVASLDQLETIASFTKVRFIQPKQEPSFWQAPATPTSLSDDRPSATSFTDRADGIRTEIRQALMQAPLSVTTPVQIGIATSQGDVTHKAFSARGTFNTDGSGMKIGVLSDGVTNLATSQSTGDLGAVTVLPGQGGSGDEGTAMLEIIHDLAPGAQLFFATAGGGIANFAQNIRNLRSAGCDIIVDDVGYLVESPFQDGQTSGVMSTSNAGLATQAVNDVVAAGALYFSAAANSGNKNDGTAGTWEGDFVDGGTLGLTPGGQVHDFDPTPGVSQFDTITASGGPLNLHWSDPLGASSNDYDLFILNSTSTNVVASSTNVQSGSQDPYEQILSGDLINNRVVIVQKTGAANRFLHVSTNRGRLNFSTEGDTHGHNASSGGYGVAAVCATCVYPSVFNSANSVELFSSDGPRRIFFNANSTAITPGNFSSTGGAVLQKPDITAADGVSVSGAGGFPNIFFGTSAAAPHAAALAALIKSANPALTAEQIRTLLTGSAIDIEGAGRDRDSGAGIVMPYAALQSMGAPVIGRAFLEISAIAQAETAGNSNGMIEPGESGTLNITLNNTGLLNATGISATLTTSTSGVAIINGSSAYPDLTASSGSGINSNSFSVSLSSSMPIDPRANFTLTINYTGGHNPSQSWDFPVQFGRQPITSTLDGTAPPTSPGYPVTSTGTQTGRLVRNDPPSTCALPQPNPGLNDSLSHSFDSYTFTNSNGAAACVTVTLTPRTTALYQAAAFLGSYDPSSITTNYLADIGSSPAPFTGKSFSFGLNSGQTVVIVVNEVVTGGAVGTPYTLLVSGLGLGTTPTPTPTPTPGPTPTLPALFGASKTGQLFTIDLGTGAGTFIGIIPVGATPLSGTTEIVFDNVSRRAFSQFSDGDFAGQEFDINTGRAIGSPISNGGSYDGLEWVGSTLYGTAIFASGGPSQLRTLNPFTGASTLIGSTGIGPVNGLAYDQATGIMYGTTGGSKSSSNLVTINLATGAATTVGSVGLNVGSLEFGPDGNLYAGSVGGTGNLYRINKNTGVGTLVGATGFTNVTGLALVTAGSPTPTPTPTPTPSPSPSPDGNIVISQIYGGGGTTGATYQNSFLEIFNRGATTVDLRQWGFWFASDTGIFNSSISFVGSTAIPIQPGQYKLILIGSPSNPFPVLPDLFIPIGVTLGTTGKIAITRPGTSFFGSTCPLPNSGISDFVGFGSSANCFEGSGPVAPLTNTTAAIRKGNGCADTDNNANDFNVGVPNPRNGSSPFNLCSPSIQFSASSYTANEGTRIVDIQVNRTGDASSVATVDFSTADGTAQQRTDYEVASGTLTFNSGDTSKTFSVLLIDDVYPESTENLTVTLSNPTGATLGTITSAQVNIIDNDVGSPTTNPLDDARFFVQQHYYDFLSRYPDAGGWDFWTNQITQCGADPVCIRNKRIDVSNAFYYELEFQQTGSYVYRLYRAAFGNNQPFPNPNPDPLHPGEEKKVPAYLQFMRDRARVTGGSQLHQSQFHLANSFVLRPEFIAKYPANLDGPTFVDALLATIRNDLGPDLTSERPALIALFDSGGRGAVMLQIAEDDAQANPINNRTFIDAEYNRAFVATQYYGYLRRDPDVGGFLFWLGQVNSGPLRDVAKQHAMVCSFITSAEYQQRVSPVVTHSNSECQ